MGVDITFFAEKLDQSGVWQLVDPVVKNSCCYPEDEDNTPPVAPQKLDIPRNIALFAMLAGVRNNERFQGCFEPLCAPRGIPTDLSPIASAYYGAWEDTFQPGWVTKKEISDYDGSRIIQRRAMVHKEVAYLFKENPLGFPYDLWPEEFGLSYSCFSSDGVEVCWRESYDQAGWSYLREVVQHYGKSTRFVFWFDL